MNNEVTVQELAETISGELIGDGDRSISGAASLETAGPGDLVFVESTKYLDQLQNCRGAAAIVPDGITPPGHMSGIKFPHPALGMACALEVLSPRKRRFTTVSEGAFVHDEATVAEGAGVAPGVYIGAGVSIGPNTEIYPGCTILDGTTVGADSVLYSGVHVYHDCEIGDRVILHSGVVIGADGYGFVQEPVQDNPAEPLRHHKVPQIGKVVIEDDVEIGANTTVDRAALHETRIQRGTKVDNLVMVGHNCSIGKHSLLVGQVGISGSTAVGDYVTLAGQAGIAGHLRIGSRVIVGAQAGVTKSLSDGKIVLGSPAIDIQQARKAYALVGSLPRFKKKLADLARRVSELEP